MHNTAGGFALYAHMPPPGIFASAIARAVHSNLVDPYEWYDRPMPGAVPRPKPTYP